MASPRVGSLLVLGVATAAAFVVVYLVFVETPGGRAVDQAALLATEARGVLTITGRNVVDVVPLVIAGLVLGGAALLRSGVWFAVGVLAALVSGTLVTELLLHSSLPQVGFPASLPSGHSTLAMSVCCSMVLVATPRWRQNMALAGSALPIVVGVLLVALGWHRPAEVLAGFLVATACAALVAAAMARLALLEPGAEVVASPGATSLVPILLALLFALGVTIHELILEVDGGSVLDWLAFAIGVLVLLVVAVALALALARALQQGGAGSSAASPAG